MYNARFTFVLKDVVVRPTTGEFEIGEVTIDVMQECNDEQVIVKLQENFEDNESNTQILFSKCFDC